MRLGSQKGWIVKLHTMCLATAVVAIGAASLPAVAQAGDGVSGELCSDPNHECTISVDGGDAREAVSYTHLTLPTSDLV